MVAMALITIFVNSIDGRPSLLFDAIAAWGGSEARRPRLPTSPAKGPDHVDLPVGGRLMFLRLLPERVSHLAGDLEMVGNGRDERTGSRASSARMASRRERRLLR
jgi:hypothetical protein